MEFKYGVKVEKETTNFERVLPCEEEMNNEKVFIDLKKADILSRLVSIIPPPTIDQLQSYQTTFPDLDIDNQIVKFDSAYVNSSDNETCLDLSKSVTDTERNDDLLAKFEMDETSKMDDNHTANSTNDTKKSALEKRQKKGKPNCKKTIQLWQFLKELLSSPTKYGHCICWLNQPEGIFRIEDSTQIAKLWGQRKHTPAMNYDKLSRSIRQYYNKGIIKKTEQSKRMVYQFCEKYRN